jgi:hypothetical protein
VHNLAPPQAPPKVTGKQSSLLGVDVLSFPLSSSPALHNFTHLKEVVLSFIDYKASFVQDDSLFYHLNWLTPSYNENSIA